jgi:hypothetical protein
MGKSTYHRVVRVLPVKYIVTVLPCIGGALFLLGSFCFWPGVSEAVLDTGAMAFLIGSLCYWVAPFVDFWEFTHNLENLLDRPLDLPLDPISPRHARTAFDAALYEQLCALPSLRT